MTNGPGKSPPGISYRRLDRRLDRLAIGILAPLFAALALYLAAVWIVEASR